MSWCWTGGPNIKRIKLQNDYETASNISVHCKLRNQEDRTLCTHKVVNKALWTSHIVHVPRERASDAVQEVLTGKTKTPTKTAPYSLWS